MIRRIDDATVAKRLFSSSPSSSSSSPSMSHSDDSVLDTGARNPDMTSFFSFRGRATEKGFASQARRLTRARKLRHLTDNEVYVPVPDLEHNQICLSPCGGDTSSSARSPVASTPQPLPLPDLNLLVRREAALASKIPIRSPKYGDDNGDGVASNAGIARLPQDIRRIAEHSEPHTSKKSSREPTGHHISAPASPFASPVRSPRPLPGDMVISSYMLPQSSPIWTPQDFPAPEKKAISVDNSPLHSPKGSSQQSIRSYAAGSSSPLPNRLSVDNLIQRRENNAQANVHPLPLPPGAAVPPHSPQVTSKPELMQVKGKWQKGKLIGRGTFGSVYVASNRETGALCAMKEVELLPDDPQSAECIRQLEQEIKVLSQLKHQNIVQYYGSEIVDDRFFIYLEYVHPGSINKYIRDHGGAMTESVVRNFTRHILSGLAYLHSTKTIHRDIKGANLLVDAYGVVKLADFGMAKHLTGQAAQLSLKGSPYWMAPELLQCVMQDDNNPDVALAVDIWSLGCTIVEMINGKPPWSEFEGPAAMFKVLKETPPIPDSMSAEGKDFLRCCFRRNPAERPTAGWLLEHRFLKNVQQLNVLSNVNSLYGMNLSEKPRTQRERPSYKLELPESVMDAQSTRRKVANTFIHGPFSPASLTNDLRT